jgi:hypothetical protein
MLGPVPAALFVASWLAQAEPAPPEPAPAAPPAAAPSPSSSPPLPPTSLAVYGRFAYRPGDSVGPAPAAGFSLGATFEHRYAAINDLVGLGVGVDLFYDHFASDQQFITTSQQLLTQTSFVALQTVSLALGRARPWVAGGGGVTWAYFSGTGLTGTGMPLPGVSDSELQPLVRGAAGLDVTVAPQMAVAVRADLTHPLTHPTFGGFGYSPFGDLVDAGVGFLYRF